MPGTPSPITVSSPDMPCTEIQGVGSNGTGLFVLWGDITKLSSKSTIINPAAIKNSIEDSNDPSARVLDVPRGYNWLDMYVMVQGASATITGFKGIVCGRLKVRDPQENTSNDPAQNAITAWSSAIADHKNQGEIWIPLDNPVTGDVEHTFPTSFTISQNVTNATSGNYPNIGGLTGASIVAHQVTARKSVFIGGVNSVMFLPTVVATLGGSGVNGVLVGRFVI